MHLRPLLFALMGMAPLACSGKVVAPGGDNPSGLAENASDLGDVVSQSASLTALLALAGSGAADPSSAATAAASIQGFFVPSGCLSTQTEAATGTSTHTFQDCAGPWGLSHVSGVVTIGFTAMPAGAVTLQVSTQGLSVHRARFDYAGTATVTTSGVGRALDYVGRLSGTTARGRSFSHDGSWVSSWRIGGSCISLDGQSAGAIDGVLVQTTVSGYERCRDECPGAGILTVDEVGSGNKVTIAFDGTSEAIATDASGSASITLACGL